MLKNYVKVALRHLYRHKGYALINILGLSLGMACSVLILLYVRDELSYDRFHQEAAATYRVNWDYNWNGTDGVGPGTPPPLAATFVRDLPEVAAATRLYPVSRMVVRHEEASFSENYIVSVDSNFFDFFDFTLVSGDPNTALAAPNRVVLTETTARKYFGDEPALGKLLTIGQEKEAFGTTYHPTFTVTGVVQDPPHNSHIQFDLLTSMASHPEVAYFDWSWIWMQVTTYVKMQEGASVRAVEAKVPELVHNYAPDAFERIGFSYDELIQSGGRFDFVFQPLTDVYLGSATIGNRLGPVGNRVYVYVFLTVAVLILLIACINFMNLATARSTTRAREVGVRKAIGSPRRTLVYQFLVESLVFSVLALPLALVLIKASMGLFNQLAGKALSLHLFRPAWGPAVLVLLTVLVGLIAGSYPGLYLSSFRPVQVLNGAFRADGKSRRLRDALVVFQFAMTIGLIACTLIVQQQLDFVREADLGFDRDGIVIISNENHRLGDQAEAFKERLTSHARVLNASISTGVPPHYGFEDYYNVEGKGDTQFDLVSYMTDDDFLATLGIEIVQGRGFSDEFSTDAEGVILNETAVQAFGLEDPIGKTIRYPSSGEYTVIGVMKDFNFTSLRAPITPFALFHRASESYQIPDSYVVVRLSRADLKASISLLESEWQAVAPDMPFEYTFLDERFDEQYRAERRLGRMFLTFSLLTIVIACLGLLGLAAFSAEQRTKEIGIRKVLGARVPGLVALLSKDFAKLVLVAFVLAAPVAYVVMRRWLEGFAYRVEISGWIFLTAGVLALAIALLTVSTQALRAARADPVRSLRYE